MRRYFLAFGLILIFILIGGGIFYYVGRTTTTSEFSSGQKEEEGFSVKLPSLKGEPIFPDDYTLKPNEVPSGFQLRKLDEKAIQEVGVTSNPGYITNKEFYRGLYEGVDVSKIKSVYGSVYVKPEAPLTELFIITVQYTSGEEFKNELQRVGRIVPPPNISQDTITYLKGKDTLVLVGRDSDEYKPQAQELVDKLKKRLNLSEI